MFEIVLNKPFVKENKSLEEYESIGELIENIFPFSEDCFCINWNNIAVSLSYKYDLSIIFEDFVYIFKFLESSENKLKIIFPSNTFDVIWDIQKVENSVIIFSIWNTVLNHNEKELNENSFLKVNFDRFKAELSELLKFIYKIIIDNKNNINNYLLSDILEDRPNNLIL
ncbi:hypothetical protein MP477_17435 [Chryseobacterium sp. WG23]|uniref:hypothetical protein n=1 Tax=Chryseobacterium sp. WG23 TaxID=2926910 RepID=UPI00211F182E|nr:hypothetical protein [Chryseobacterium sp. WG23]MCQ9636741.1 hypothetical protein [Chryseobacterium sp. WG23]